MPTDHQIASLTPLSFATLLIVGASLVRGEENDMLPKCQPGSHLSPASANRCIPCKEGSTFMDIPNRELECRPCTRCDGIAVQVSACSPVVDALCKCPDGYFKNIEGKCSPKVAASSREAAIGQTSFEHYPIVESSCSVDKIQHFLIFVIAIMTTVAVILAVATFIIIVRQRKQQKRLGALMKALCNNDENCKSGLRNRNDFYQQSKRLSGRSCDKLRKSEYDASSYSMVMRQVSLASDDEEKNDRTVNQRLCNKLQESTITHQPPQGDFSSSTTV